MLSPTAANIPTTGIMFAPTDHPDQPFPALPSSNEERGTPGAHEFLPYDFPLADFPGWLLIARNPHTVTYYDDDAQATDETNWDVITGAAGPIHPAVWHRWEDDDVTQAWEHGALTVEGVLLVAPARVAPDQAGDDEWEREHRARITGLVDLAQALADYPLLDESAYSEREHDAWCEYAADGLRHDTTRALADAGLDPATIEAVDDAWPALWPVAAEHLTYTNGFTGEHAPDFAECIAHAIAAALSCLT
jgi:hypothetical protein